MSLGTAEAAACRQVLLHGVRKQIAACQTRTATTPPPNVIQLLLLQSGQGILQLLHPAEKKACSCSRSCSCSPGNACNAYRCLCSYLSTAPANQASMARHDNHQVAHGAAACCQLLAPTFCSCVCRPISCTVLASGARPVEHKKQTDNSAFLAHTC
jgi:hypothetical protein